MCVPIRARVHLHIRAPVLSVPMSTSTSTSRPRPRPQEEPLYCAAEASVQQQRPRAAGLNDRPRDHLGSLALLRPCGAARVARNGLGRVHRTHGAGSPAAVLCADRARTGRRVRHLPASDRSNDGTARSDAQRPREAGERQDGRVAGGVSLQAWAPPPCPLRAQVSLCPGGEGRVSP